MLVLPVAMYTVNVSFKIDLPSTCHTCFVHRDLTLCIHIRYGYATRVRQIDPGDISKQQDNVGQRPLWRSWICHTYHANRNILNLLENHWENPILNDCHGYME